MKSLKAHLSLPLFIMFLLFSSFTPAREQKVQSAIINYAWYTPSGQFVAWSTLINAEIVSDATTDPTNGTLVLIGYTGGDFGVPPVGAPVYYLYTHP